MTEATAPIVTTDAQDPLPESNWLWRRVFTFAVTAAILWMTWGAISRLGAVAVTSPAQGIPALLKLCQWLIWVQIMLVTYYMIAPSAEQISKMIQHAGLLRSGVKFASSTATTETPAGTTTTATAASAGMPPIEPAPVAGGDAIAAPVVPTPPADELPEYAR